MTTIKVSRYDIGRMDKAQRTPEGYLVAPVRAARIGVLTYYDAYGKPFKELVPADELFKDDSMSTLALKPLTAKNHPSVMLDSQNYKQYAVGLTGEKVSRDDRFLATTVVVQDADAIKMVESGMQEVSCGYVAELEITPGEFEGEKYDAIQRNRHYNHLAIVDRGRAGREARLRLDSQFNLIEEENTMKFKIVDKEFDIPQEVADHIGAQAQMIAALTTGKADAESKLAAANTQNVALKADAEKVQALSAEVAKQTGRADTAEAKVKELQDPTKFNDQVKARIALIETAKPLLDEEMVKKLDSMSDIEIRKAAILARNKDAKLDGKDEAFINAYFDGMMASPISQSDDGGLGKGLLGNRKDMAEEGCDPKTGKPMNGGKVPLKDKWKQPLSLV